MYTYMHICIHVYSDSVRRLRAHVPEEGGRDLPDLG